MTRSLLLFLLLNVQAALYSQSNEGTNFWFGFMEHRDVGLNTMVVMITSKNNTNGIVQFPGGNWSQNFSVQANNVTVIELPREVEVTQNEQISHKGINIVSQEPVSVYIHQYFGLRSEAAMVLPQDAIGDAYYAVTYNAIIWRNIIYPAEFLIVGTQEDTQITIHPSDITENDKAVGTPISITLNTGDTYLVQTKNELGDFTGSLIEGDKPFALFSGNSWVEVPLNCGARDNLLEQMIPIDTWGKQYLTVPSSQVNFDVFRILAAEDNTTVEVQGDQTQTFILNAGEFTEYTESSATFIQADKPISVIQYLVGTQCSGHTIGDPSMVVLNSIEQTRDTVTLFNSSFEAITENFINVITKTIDADLVVFDGIPIKDRGIPFTPVGKKADFSYARIQVNPGAHTIISEGCGVIATAYGYGEAESYAYGGGASFSAINANPIPEGGCLNDTVFFDTGLSPNRFNFDWDLGNGIRRKEATFNHFFPDLGAYPIRLILEDECLGTIDTIDRDLQITLRQAVSTEPDQTLCEGAPFQLGATDLVGARYEWTGPSNFTSEEQFPQIVRSSLRMDGDYSVIGIVSGCATFPALLNIDILENPSPNLGEDDIICVKKLEVDLYPGAFETYQWQDNSARENFSVPSGGGQYWVEVTDENGCIGRDSIVLIQQCPTAFYIPDIFSPNGDGNNDFFQVHAQDITEMRLTIFNRWGGIVFQSTNLDDTWDGNFNGLRSPEGVYLYELSYSGFRADSSTFSDQEYGTITLIR